MSYNSRPQGPSLDDNLISKLAEHCSSKGVILGFVFMALAAGTVVGIENASKHENTPVEYSYSPTSM